MRNIFLVAALMCFITAAVIDYPATPPTFQERTLGNFCCSLGFCFLTLALIVNG